MGTNRWKKYKIEQLPIKDPSKFEEAKISQVVDKILSIKKTDPNSDTRNLEYAIDKLIYKLYKLSKEEIKIIEESF